nr:immunoglobulin light chain junction region [Macaca mulatta]
CLQYASRPPTF